MIDKSKQYRTRDGREVRIYATDGMGECPVHGAIRFDGSWEVNTWTARGSYTAGGIGPHDLIEEKPRIQREVWVNVYPNKTGMDDQAHGSKASADVNAGKSRIACVRLTIDVEEGEGL